MLIQILTPVLAHQWFRKHEPTLSTAAACSLVLPLANLAIESKLSQPHAGLHAFLDTFSISLFFLRVLFFCFSLGGLIICYRLSPLHPLADYPGPLICKVTKLWGAWVALRGDFHWYVKDLHDRYGPIVRVGPNELSFAEKDAISHILGSQGMPRGPLWDGRRFHQGSDDKPYDSLIDVRDDKIHHQLRKGWNNAFSAGPVKDYQELLEIRGKQLRDHIQSFSAKPGKGAGTPVDFAKWFSLFAFDFMGDLAFGGCFELMRDGDVHGFFTAMEEGMELPAVMQHVPWINSLMLSIPFISSRMRAFSSFGVQQATNRAAMQTKRKDLFYHLYELPADERGGSIADQMELIVSDCLLTIVAGSDTTSTTLSAILCYLLSDRKVYDTLRGELDEAFPSHSVDGWPEIEIDKVGKLSYLNAVINEGLRLVPALPTHLQRAPEAGSGGKVLGDMNIFIPEGTAVNISPFTLHRDSRYFSPSPEAFIPERWLANSEGMFTTNREAFIPFSYGPANCAGKPLAIIELRYIVAILIRSFDIYHAGCKDATPEVLEAKAESWVNALKDRFVFGKGELLVEIVSRK
ncbi:hypothetical protein H1R20_g2468, partial [Candolleomyces eurysporus]